jgi:DNA-binding NarL/FixJ family response regulator
MLMRHVHPTLQFTHMLPYGAILHENGVQFVVYSRSATAMRLFLYENVDDPEPEEIIEAVSTVYNKGFYFNEHLSITLIKQLVGNDQADNIPNNRTDLNEREIEVLKLVCQECSNQEIADKIFLSVRTVEGYRARLFEKTGSKNLVGLVIYAIKRGIINVT